MTKLLDVLADKLRKTRRKKEEAMDAIELLKTQHDKVKAIFKKLEDGKGDAIAGVLELMNNLAAHMAIEQDIFYPAIIAADPDLVSEAFEEHSIAEFAMKRLLATDPQEDAFKARVVAAKELIEHHVKEEEEELFKKVKKMLDKEQLQEMGAQMKARFDEVYAAGYQSAVPSSVSKTSADVARADLHVTDGDHEKPAKNTRRSAPAKRAAPSKARRGAPKARARSGSGTNKAAKSAGARSLPRVGKKKSPRSASSRRA